MKPLADWQKCWALRGTAQCQNEALPGQVFCQACLNSEFIRETQVP